jgi:hypothetical protein
MGGLITHDPFLLKYGIRKIYADLEAEKLFAAEKEQRRIVVEVKSFRGSSEVEDLQEAVGSYVMYLGILTVTFPERDLYLAVPEDAYIGIFSEMLGQRMIQQANLKLVVFRPKEEVIKQWIP